MSYKAQTIIETIKGINQIYYLPSIQRKFVWPEEKICNLFESIMNGYPIGTLLTWEISGEKINADNAIGFYEFIKNWSEYDGKFNSLLKNVLGT